MPNSRLYHGVMCQMTAVEILDNNESTFWKKSNAYVDSF